MTKLRSIVAFLATCTPVFWSAIAVYFFISGEITNGILCMAVAHLASIGDLLEAAKRKSKTSGGSEAEVKNLHIFLTK
jgi:hypothetical protein